VVRPQSVDLSAQLRADSPGWLLRPQLVRAGTGVGSNYRAACRGKSRSDFIVKLTTAEEADETSYWLELLVECKAFPIERVRPMLQEASELTAIFVSSVKTARQNRR
jgi:four helix bundle protein